ncbi:MAG: NAD(P)/FAD-dependent oxidoreductase [Crocinitomicaceae bacterium]|nr:NAD(P)/FAD-dependent oxidoreductase [Crocinitomicaceae bacterium]
MRVGIIGGGAAGFFSAIHVKENYPNAEVIILEKSTKILSKVKVSGGGRCNVCNGCTDIDELSKNYPRGGRQLRKLFGFFSSADTMAWFEKRGVPLVIQEDQCVFPKSQNSQSIIDCFMNECLRLGVKIRTSADVIALLKSDDDAHFYLELPLGETLQFDKVIVTTGGQAKAEKFDWLRKTGHEIEEPVPSLFTFNMPNEPVKSLMGIVVEDALVSIRSTNLKANGPLLITHWGMSGPAILKLSAFGARILADKKYDFVVSVNWLNLPNESEIRSRVEIHLKAGGNKQISNFRIGEIPQRLWDYLLDKIQIPLDKNCAHLNSKEINKLVNILSNDAYQVSGKTTFKEEFVTCGGVSLNSVSIRTMQSKKMKGLYFAGEVLDIDGVTGGFNFQAAWTTAFVAAKLGEE